MAKQTKTTQPAVNPIQQKLDALVAQRDEQLNMLETAKQQYEAARLKIVEINGAIQVLVDLFSTGESNDSESEVNESTSPDKD